MRCLRNIAILIAAACMFSFTLAFPLHVDEDWGFYAHRLINRMAVFTLPPELIVFFKKNINFISEHAVDPDKRRYSNSFEAIRHYIDIDHWGEPPFDNLPRDWRTALAKFTVLKAVSDEGDTVEMFNFPVKESFVVDSVKINLPDGKELVISKGNYLHAFNHLFYPQYYAEEWEVDASIFLAEIGEKDSSAHYTIVGVDRLSPFGVVPYFLPRMQHRLTDAFKKKDVPRILNYAAELGHYIADAHVPLHTTVNYDGDLTGQDGIHAFWESRIPELFAERQFDFFVGKAVYIENKEKYFWDIVLKSHSYVDSVLLIEKRLRESWDKSAIYCYDERLGRIVRTECAAYAAAYNEAMNDMVEKRFRHAIKAVGSAWYTAWIDAGQPQLGAISDTVYHYIDPFYPQIGNYEHKFQIRKH